MKEPTPTSLEGMGQIPKNEVMHQKARKLIGLPTLTLFAVISISLGLIPGLPGESLGYLVEAAGFFMVFAGMSQLYFVYHDYQVWKALNAGDSISFFAYEFSNFVPKTFAGQFLLFLALAATAVLMGLSIAFFLGHAAFLQPFFDMVFHFLDNALIKVASDFGGTLVSPVLSQFAANVFGAVFLSVLPLVLLNAGRAFSAETQNNFSTGETTLRHAPNLTETDNAQDEGQLQLDPGGSLQKKQKDDVTDKENDPSSAQIQAADPVINEPTTKSTVNWFKPVFHQLPEEEKDVDMTLRAGIVAKPVRKTPMYKDSNGTRKGDLWNFDPYNDYLLLKEEPKGGKVLVETIPHLCAQLQTRHEAYVDINDIEFFAASEVAHIPKRFPEEYKHGCHTFDRLSWDQIKTGAYVMAMRDIKPSSGDARLKLEKFEIYQIGLIEETIHQSDPYFRIESKSGSNGYAVLEDFWYVGMPPESQLKPV